MRGRFNLNVIFEVTTAITMHNAAFCRAADYSFLVTYQVWRKIFLYRLYWKVKELRSESSKYIRNYRSNKPEYKVRTIRK